MSLPCSQEASTGSCPEWDASFLPRTCATFFKKLAFYGEIFLALFQPQGWKPPLVDCQRLLIKYIHIYRQYLQAVSSINNPRTRHIVMTGAHVTHVICGYWIKFHVFFFQTRLTSVAVNYRHVYRQTWLTFSVRHVGCNGGHSCFIISGISFPWHVQNLKSIY